MCYIDGATVIETRAFDVVRENIYILLNLPSFQFFEQNLTFFLAEYDN